MSTTQAVPKDNDMAIRSELYIRFELGGKSWKLRPATAGMARAVKAGKRATPLPYSTARKIHDRYRAQARE